MNYSSNANCEWMIVSGSQSLINLQFSSFSTQPLNDVVRVFHCTDIACPQPQQLAELSGTYLSTQEVVSPTGFMKVVFTSDSSVNYGGFSAKWSLVSHVHTSLPI
jgi:hypothetical protein